MMATATTWKSFVKLICYCRLPTKITVFCGTAILIKDRVCKRILQLSFKNNKVSDDKLDLNVGL